MNLHRGFWEDVRLGGRWGWASIWGAGTLRGGIVAVPFMIAGAATAQSFLFHVLCVATRLPGNETSDLQLRLLHGLCSLGAIPIMSFAHGVAVVTALGLLGIQTGVPHRVYRAALSRWPRFLTIGSITWALYYCLLPLSPLLATVVSAAFAMLAYPAVAVAPDNWFPSGLKAIALFGRSPLRFAGGLVVVALVFLPMALPFFLWFTHVSKDTGVDLAGAAFVGLLGSPFIIFCWFFGAVFWAKTSGTPVKGGILEPAQPPVRTISGEMIGVGLALRLPARLFDLLVLFFSLLFYFTPAVGLIEAVAHLPSGQLLDVLLRHQTRWHDLAVLSLWTAYEIGFTAAAGATPGKHLLRLRIVAVDGSRLTLWRCVLRWVGLALIPAALNWMGVWLDGLTQRPLATTPVLRHQPQVATALASLLVLLYFLWPAWQWRKRGFQDFIAGSVVIRLASEKAAEVESLRKGSREAPG